MHRTRPPSTQFSTKPAPGGSRSSDGRLRASTTDPLGAPADPATGQTRADLFLDVRPSVVLSHTGRRAVQRLTAGLVADLFLTRPEANAWSARLEYGGLYRTSRVTDLMMGASAMF